MNSSDVPGLLCPWQVLLSLDLLGALRGPGIRRRWGQSRIWPPPRELPARLLRRGLRGGVWRLQPLEQGWVTGSTQLHCAGSQQPSGSNSGGASFDRKGPKSPGPYTASFSLLARRGSQGRRDQPLASAINAPGLLCKNQRSFSAALDSPPP